MLLQETITITDKSTNKQKSEYIDAIATNIELSNNFIYNTAQISDHLKDHTKLSMHFFKEKRNIPKKIVLPKGVYNLCYQCMKKFRSVHGIYIKCCTGCGEKNYARVMDLGNRLELENNVVFLTGGRTKIGYQTATRLLRLGADVIISTRSPVDAMNNYKKEFDSDKWINKLHIYELPLDLNNTATNNEIQLLKLQEWIHNKFGKLDVLINLAAQTIRNIEKFKGTETNRYGDNKHFPKGETNSWNLRLGEISAIEIQEVFNINAIAPLIIFQTMLPLLLKSTKPSVINIHAKEGVFTKKKNSNHPHTNMAKSALHQLTLMINITKFKTENGIKKIKCYGVDPGWVSVDEYEFESCPLRTPPLTELDGAARIVYPLVNKKSSLSKFTIRHYTNFVV